MKSHILKTSIGTVIFLILVIAVTALVQPVYSRLRKSIVEQEQRLQKVLREKTGLAVSYESMSPSILSSINIKGIVVSDAETGKKLLDVRSASLSYDAGKRIKALTVKGLTAEFDAVKDVEVQKKISAFIAAIGAGSKNEENDKKEQNDSAENKNTASLVFDNLLALRNLELPFDVFLKNISFHYSDADNDVSAFIKKASFKETESRDCINTLMNGSVSFTNRYIKIGNRRAKNGCNLSVNGTLLPSLDGSSVSIRVSGQNGADYTLGKIDFLLNYEDSRFTLRTMRTVWPVSFLISADLAERKLSFSATADSFNPFLLLKIKRQRGLVSKLNGMSMSGSFSADAYFPSQNEKSTGSKKISYSADGSFLFPEQLSGSPLSVLYDFDGDLRRINFKTLLVNGKKIGANFTGSYDVSKNQPSGTFTLDHFVLANGGVLSTDVYIEPQNNGFMCFSPQLFLGEQAFTALQLTVMPVRNSIDFSFEADDYSHTDYGTPGHIKIDGSYLTGKNQFLQAGIVISDEFMDSVLRAVCFFLPSEKASTLNSCVSAVSPFICSDEMYVSTDFKQFSFNAPYCVVANTQKDRELLVFALDGSNQTIQLSRFDLIFGNQTAHASAQADFNDSGKEGVFSVDFSVNTIPYRFSGNYSNGWIGVTGDYGLDAALSFGNDISGSLKFTSLPLTVGSNVFALSANTTLLWTKEDGISVNIIGFEAEEPAGRLAFHPRLTMSGTANRYGIVFDSIAYSDSVSALNGGCTMMWNYNNDMFDSAHASFLLESPLTKEKYSFEGDLSNPTHAPLNFTSLKNDIYFSSTVEAVASPMSRFIADQSSDDTLSASLSASGTLSNPFVTVTVQNFSFALLGSPMIGHGTFVLDDSGISTRDVGCTWMGFSILHINSLFNQKDFSGSSEALFTGAVAGQSVKAPFTVKIFSNDEEKKSFIPSKFTAVIDAPEVSGDLFDNPVPFRVTMNRIPGRLDIFSGTGTGVNATVLDDGHVSVRTGSSVPFVFNVDGTATTSSISLAVSNVYADLAKISKLIDIPDISFSGGELYGGCRVEGMPTDPELTGAFTVTGFNLDAPDFLQNSLCTDRILITVGQSGLSIPETVFKTGKGSVVFSMNASFDRWKLAETDIWLKTPEKSFVPIDLKVPYIHYKGDTNFDLNMKFMSDGMEFNGNVLAQDGIFEVVTSSLQASLTGEDISASVPKSEIVSSMEKIGLRKSIKVQMSLLFGQHVQIQFNPLMRGIVVPDTPFSFYFDNDTDSLLLKGDIALRGGEIAWLNRNFYMKAGRVVFNETKDKMDPRLTVRAETRERDDEGNQVRIILSANNQPISTFSPQLSASPAKSELEIMELLGQIVTADSDNVSSFVMAGGDYIVQATVMRRIENALRELCNFDIFSVRTMVLQNALKQGLNINSGSSKLTVGNFFDNSTVYIGKYFGSSLYVDALMHWSYDKSKVNDSATVGGLVFQPEFGLEMASPFATIRWGIAPDIEAIQNNMWVPSASITLSWKFLF